MKTFLKIALTAFAVILIAKLMPSVEVTSYTTALWVAVVLALLNTFIKPILILLTLPATILSLGFFILIINACIVLMASNLVGGFYVSGFGTAFFFSLLLWVFRSLLFSLLKEDRENA